MFGKSSPYLRPLAAALLAAAGIAGAQTQTEIHLDAATRNVGDDPFIMKFARAFYCNLPEDNNQIVVEARGWNNTTGTGDNAIYRFPLTQIFDDVWIIGNDYVAQYMMKTPDGLVQVDAANNANEVATFHAPALQQLGLAATYPLKAVLLTHGHGDHDGGASWIKTNIGTEVVLGSADAAGKAYTPTPIDSTNLAMREMSIGGKKFWVLPTPGHTPGATSAVLEVMDHGKPVRVLINGGQSMTSSIPQVVQYLDSIERTWAMAKALHVEGVMTPHIYWDGEREKVRDIIANGRTNPSQNVYGHDSVMRQLVVARECSAAWLTRLDTTAVLPVWRHNRLELLNTNPTLAKVSARLANAWGPLPNQTVTFTVGEAGASCSATTDADGVATCRVRHVLRRTDVVNASFAGASSTDFVDLPAVASTAFCRGKNCAPN